MMAPAATPITANGVESWNQPVMATIVVHMQKEDGKNAEEKTHKYPKNLAFKKKKKHCSQKWSFYKLNKTN